MKSRITHLTWIALIVALAAVLAPTAALAGKPEARQFATYLSGILPPKPTPAESGRAEAAQFAAYLGGAVKLPVTPAASARAETKQIAVYLGGIVSTAPSSPTPAESSRAETNAFAGSMRLAMTQPRVTGYEPGGFDWGDAGIGAAAMLGVVLLLAGLLVGLAIPRRNQGRQVVPSG